MSTRILTVLLVCVIYPVLGQQPPPVPPASVVFVSHDPNAINNYKADTAKVRSMVDRLVMATTGQPDVAKAWGSLVAPGDKVGIKISAAGGELFTTHHAVVKAIVDGLAASGHPRNTIIVWDRSLAGIKDAGYRPGAEGYQLRSVAPKDGYDLKAVISAPLLGKLVWGDLEYRADLGKMAPLSDTENTSNLSHFSKILANDVAKIINVPVMSNSEMNGIAGCLYNVTLPNIDNWRRFAQGSRFGGGSLAEIYADPNVGKKVVINIMDGLLAQFGGGPQPQPNFSLHFATLYASKDPVAIDSIVRKRVEQWRARTNLPKIGPFAFYIDVAGQMGLGNTNPARIEIRSVGPSKPE